MSFSEFRRMSTQISDKVYISLSKLSSKISSKNLHALLKYHQSTCILTVLDNIYCSFRVYCYKISTHPYWCNFILVCIIISSALLAAEDPLDSKSLRNQVGLLTGTGINHKEYVVSIITSVYGACLNQKI